jgi:hypothetical protein
VNRKDTNLPLVDGKMPAIPKGEIHTKGKWPIHSARKVMGQLKQSEFKRMGHPPNSPDLSPCDFFLYGTMKGQLKGRNFAEKEELLSVLSALMSEIPPDIIAGLCQLGSTATPLYTDERRVYWVKL